MLRRRQSSSTVAVMLGGLVEAPSHGFSAVVRNRGNGPYVTNMTQKTGGGGYLGVGLRGICQTVSY